MKTKILIIEDEPDFAHITKALLDNASDTYEAEITLDAKEGLSKIINGQYDLILCDYRMPGLSGMDILHAIRKEKVEIPFIVITASGSEKVAVDFMKSGASDYVIKDSGYEDTLQMVIEKSLERYRAAKEKESLQREIKEAYIQLKQTQKELIQSEKLAALGSFSSGIAHEVKNPLSIILGGIEYLEMSPSSLSDDTKTTLHKMKEATLRADEIIRGLLTFSRPSELKTEPIDPKVFIQDTLSLIKYRRTLRNIEIRTQFPSVPLTIEVDKNQMQQVIFNILMNAVQAMPQGGTITISVSQGTAKKDLIDAQYCIITIADTGEGIPPSNLSRLYEPFFTTKRNEGGTGLGLSIARMIIENHQGLLDITSTPKKGTSVTIMLPLLQGETSHEEDIPRG